MFNTIGHQGNANWNHDGMTLIQCEWIKSKRLKSPTSDENVKHQYSLDLAYALVVTQEKVKTCHIKASIKDTQRNMFHYFLTRLQIQFHGGMINKWWWKNWKSIGKKWTST